MASDQTKKLRDIHARFRRGDHVTTPEMKLLLKTIKAAMPFLMTGPEYTLAFQQARRDEINLEQYLAARARERVA